MRHRRLLSVAMHGNDERIAIAGLEQGTDMLTRVVQSVAAR